MVYPRERDVAPITAHVDGCEKSYKKNNVPNITLSYLNVVQWSGGSDFILSLWL